MLLLCVWKPAFLRSGHNYAYTITICNSCMSHSYVILVLVVISQLSHSISIFIHHLQYYKFSTFTSTPVKTVLQENCLKIFLARFLQDLLYLARKASVQCKTGKICARFSARSCKKNTCKICIFLARPFLLGHNNPTIIYFYQCEQKPNSICQSFPRQTF